MWLQYAKDESAKILEVEPNKQVSRFVVGGHFVV